MDPASAAPVGAGLTRLGGAPLPGESAPLRVALVCPYSLSRPGGVQGQVVGLGRALERRGHRVVVYAPLDDPADAPAGLELVPTGRSRSLPANGSMAPVALSVRAAAGAMTAMRTGHPDLVHVHEPFAPGLPYGVLLSRWRPPVVATFHRSGASALYAVLAPAARRLAARLDLRCAVSEAARRTAVAALGGDCEVCFNGVELGTDGGVEPWPSERPAVLFLGRHERRKGLAVLLDAFGRVLADRRAHGEVGPVLWVAGDGPRTESLRRDHPGSDDLRWLGVITEEEKARRLAGAAVLCAPSLGGESFGMVLLEAMAARTLVVASDISGYREVAGDHALLVPPGDAPALAGVLGEALALASAGPGEGDGSLPAASWLEDAAGWASQWSMDRLSAWYEERYRRVVARSAD